MGMEIERKFLVRSNRFKEEAARAAHTDGDAGVYYRQGYIPTLTGVTARIRIAGEKGYITLKDRTVGFSRHEFEYPVPKEEAEQMLEQKRNVKRMESKEGDEAAAEKELREEARKDAEKSVREAIIIDTIAEKEKIEIAESDLSHYVMQLSRSHNIPPMEIYKLLRKPQFAMQITRNIISEKALKFVVEQAKKNGAA